MEVLELIDKLKENYSVEYIAKCLYHEYPMYAMDLSEYIQTESKADYYACMEEANEPRI